MASLLPYYWAKLVNSSLCVKYFGCGILASKQCWHQELLSYTVKKVQAGLPETAAGKVLFIRITFNYSIVIVVDLVKWAILHPQADSLQLETWGLLFPASAIFFFPEWKFFRQLHWHNVSFCLPSFVFSENLIYSLLCGISNIESFPPVSLPMEATFSSWILSVGLSGTHNLTASRLRHKDSCIHHVQTLFVKESIVAQHYQFCVFFWLTCFVFLDLLGLFYIVRCLKSGCVYSSLMSIWYVDSV